MPIFKRHDLQTHKNVQNSHTDIDWEQGMEEDLKESIGCVNVGDLALLWFPDNFGSDTIVWEIERFGVPYARLSGIKEEGGSYVCEASQWKLNFFK